MRIRYFADIRFPLERANGVQTMETCHALARRGHEICLVVRPDSAMPARDPWAYYGLPRVPALTIEYVAAPASPSGRRAAYVAHSVWRSLGRARADAILTRDLTIASLLLRLPASARPPVVYESHGFAPAVAEDLPKMLSSASALSAAKGRRLEARERLVWARAGGYITITAALARELEGRFGPRPRLAVVPDGARLPELEGVGLRPDPEPPGPSWGTLGISTPGRGPTCCSRRSSACPAFARSSSAGSRGSRISIASARWQIAWPRAESPSPDRWTRRVSRACCGRPTCWCCRTRRAACLPPTRRR